MWKWFKKQPVKIRGIVLTGIFGIIIACIEISPNIFDSSETDVYDNELCNTIENTLNKWISGYDIRFKKSYDSLRHRLSVKVGLESGLAVKTEIEFCIDKRLEKDTKIDYFILDYLEKGCDLDSLDIVRKLPINVRNIAKRRTMDYGPHYQGIILDTL